MIKNKYVFVTIMLAAILAVAAGLTALYIGAEKPADQSDDKLHVVTSFYPMYVACENILGDCEDVMLDNLSEPQTGCLHDYQLTSEDMKLLSTADIFVVNGGGIESFLGDVAKQYPDLLIVNACEEIQLLEDNPHAWMNADLYCEQLNQICRKIAEADPSHAQEYEANTMAYEKQVQELLGEYKDVLLAYQNQPVILLHEADEYLADQLGMPVAGVMDLDEERQISAGEVADIMSTIQEENVQYVFAEELYGSDMGQTIQKETDVKVIYLDTLTRGEYQADSYLGGMRANYELLKGALE